MYCPNCGTKAKDENALYCEVCGTRIVEQPVPTIKRPEGEQLLSDLHRIESEPKPYEALRFVSGLIVFFGWLMIIGGWFLGFTVAALYTDTLSDAGPYFIARNKTWLISTFIGMVSTIQGLFMIAGGQVFMVLLDLRNDMHTTMGFVQRFGLSMFDNKS